MIFLPFGVASNEVCDPDPLFEDFQEAARRAADLNAWSFAEAGLANHDLDGSAQVQFSASTEVDAALGVTPGSGPTLPNDGGADADLWLVPRNGLMTVGSSFPGDEAETVTWVSEVPEMVLLLYSFQYLRYRKDDARWSTYFAAGVSSTDPIAYRNLRFQIRLRLDGAEVTGSGPPGVVEDGIVRGAGIANRSVGSVLQHAALLPPGAHSADAVAGMLSPAGSYSYDNSEGETYGADVPTDGAAIGHRRMIVVRFPLGGALSPG